MGDMADDFRVLRESGQKKRRDNRVHSTELLKQQGIPFESKNGGVHLIVDGCVDFWPSTGLFIPRDTKYSKDRGVFRLMKFVRARQLERQRAE